VSALLEDLHRIWREESRVAISISIDTLERDALQKIVGRKRPEIMQVLAGRLADDRPRMRWISTVLLGEAGPSAAPFVPDLVAALRRETCPDLTPTFMEALAGIGPVGVTAIIGVLDDPNPEIRIAAITVLGQMGPEARGAVPAIRRFLDDGVQDVRIAAGNAIAKIEGEGRR
jgi:hypothetical protein